jgi:hypothetical protein
VVRVPLLLGDAALGVPAELAHVVPEWKLALVGMVAIGLVVLAWRMTRLPGTPDRTLAWLAVGGLAATIPGAAGFPGGRVLVIPDLAFAAILGAVIYRGLEGTRSGGAAAILLALVHLGLAPVAGSLSVQTLVRRAQATSAIAKEIEHHLSPSGVAFIVAASDPMVYFYPRSILADVAPGSVRCLSTLSAARSRHHLTRTGRHTFTLELVDRPLLDGSFERLFRSSDHRFAIGDTTEQCGATVRVVELASGLPTRLAIEMRRSLDDPELPLLVWRDGRLERLAMPAVGSTIELPWSPGPTGVL